MQYFKELLWHTFDNVICTILNFTSARNYVDTYSVSSISDFDTCFHLGKKVYFQMKFDELRAVSHCCYTYNICFAFSWSKVFLFHNFTQLSQHFNNDPLCSTFLNIFKSYIWYLFVHERTEVTEQNFEHLFANLE